MSEKYILEKSKDNYDILKIDNEFRSIYIGSKYNENREVKKVIELAKPIRENDNYIILGLGMGNHIKELEKIKSAKSQILIIECEKEWIREFKNKIRDGNYLKNDIHIAESIVDIKKFFDTYINEQNISGLKIIPYSNYNKFYKKELLNYYKSIKEYRNNIMTNRNTNLWFSKIWFESQMKNIKYIPQSESVSSYKGKHKGKPAIIVSAGPSLSKNIDELSKCNEAVIISGGRTLKSLINIGVDPDYTVIVDGSDKSYELVDGYINKVKSKLVYHLGTPYRALEEHCGRKIICSSEPVIDEVMNKKNYHIATGGSVAHSMTSLAIIMGCNPIIFIGQDFAYTYDKGHASVASSPWESVELENYSEDNDFFVEDIYGNTVRTSEVLNIYRLQMEKIVEINKDIVFINATEGGANIRGTEVRNLRDVLANYSDVVNYENEEIYFSKEVNEKLVNKLENSCVAMKELYKLYSKGLEILEEYEKAIKYGLKNISKLENEINIIDKKILKLNKKMIFMDNLIYPIIDSLNNLPELIYGIEDNEKQVRDKNLKKNLLIYREMKNTITYALPIVKDSIEELKAKEF